MLTNGVPTAAIFGRSLNAQIVFVVLTNIHNRGIYITVAPEDPSCIDIDVLILDFIKDHN